MKFRVFILLFNVFFCLGLLGCTNAGESTEQLSESEPIVIHAIQTDPRQKNMLTKLQEFVFDLDGDGKEETIELHTAAGRDEDGNMAWDDGQNWLLVVVNGNGYYPLLQEYVQLGTVYFTVTDDQNGTIIISVIVNTGAGMKLVSFTYDQDQNGYRGEVVYHIGGNQIFNGLRTY